MRVLQLLLRLLLLSLLLVTNNSPHSSVKNMMTVREKTHESFPIFASLMRRGGEREADG